MRPRIRTLKPEAFQHPKVGRLSFPARWLWAGMLHHADDEGRLLGDAGQLRLLIFGYDEDVGPGKMEELLEEVALTRLVTVYEVDGVRYVAFPDWREHQRVQHPSPSKLPPPPQLASGKARERSRGLKNAHEGSGTRSPDRIGSGSGSGSEEDRAGGVEAAPRPAPPPVWLQVPEEILAALRLCPTLARAPALSTPKFWQAVCRSHQRVDYAKELLKAEAWLTANPERAPHKNFARFVNTWMSRAATDAQT